MKSKHKLALIVLIGFVLFMSFQNCGMRRTATNNQDSINTNEGLEILSRLDPNCKLTEERSVTASANCELSRRSVLASSPNTPCAGFVFDIARSDIDDLALVLRASTPETCIAKVIYANNEIDQFCIHNSLRNGKNDPAWWLKGDIVSIQMIPSDWNFDRVDDGSTCIPKHDNFEVPATFEAIMSSKE